MKMKWIRLLGQRLLDLSKELIKVKANLMLTNQLEVKVDLMIQIIKVNHKVKLRKCRIREKIKMRY